MKHYTEIDNKIQRGYLCMLENQTAKGCDVWLDAWENINVYVKNFVNLRLINIFSVNV